MVVVEAFGIGPVRRQCARRFWELEGLVAARVFGLLVVLSVGDELRGRDALTAELQ
ncbi:MAG: hypothetical protein ACRD0Q_02630 [Acidimicrobiales bacterium]